MSHFFNWKFQRRRGVGGEKEVRDGRGKVWEDVSSEAEYVFSCGSGGRWDDFGRKRGAERNRTSQRGGQAGRKGEGGEREEEGER